MTQAAIYARISDDREGSGLGVKRQEKDCRALAKARGWTVAEVYVDNDISAFSGKHRPAYEAMLAEIDAGRINAVVIWHPDRLHRSPRELEDFITLIERTGTTVVTVTAGEYDLATPDGRMNARIVGTVARKESEDKSRRLRRKHVELAEAGKVSGGGTRPFGYEQDRRTIVKAEARTIRAAAKRVLAGESLRGVATDLNASGVTTVTGRPWSTYVLRTMLCSARIAGLREHRGEVVAEADWPGIITRTEHEQLVAILRDPARRTNQAARRYLFAGMAYCQLCDAKLVSRPRSDRVRCYVCASGVNFGGCGKIRILAGDPEVPDPEADPQGIEDLIVEALLQRVDSPKLAAKLKRQAPAVDVDTAALERKLDELAIAWANDEMDRRSWLAARKRVSERLAAARRQQATSVAPSPLAPYAGNAGALRAAWPKLTFDQRRAIVGAAIDRVVIGPGVRGLNRFDPRRVDVEWKV